MRRSFGFVPDDDLPQCLTPGEDYEEQEEELVDPPGDAEAIQEKLNRILQSYHQNGKVPGQISVDTMEFRPSDAKKGEFDRLPF